MVDQVLLHAIGSSRGIAVVHLVAWYAAVAFFVLSAQPLLRSAWGRAVFAAVAFMHPQLLMWAGTIRWYPVWWGLALVVLAAGLLPRRHDRVPSLAVTVMLGVAAAALLYMDYLAFIFLPCFAVAWVVRHGLSRPSVGRLLAMAGIGIVLAWPVVSWFPNQHALRQCAVAIGNPLGAALFMAHGLSIGQSILPWHPVSVIVVLGLLLPCGWWFAREFFRRWRESRGTDPAGRRELAAVLCFLVLMVAAAIASGLGTKPRSFLGLAVVMGLLIALGAERVTSRPGRGLVAALMVLWIATGAYHLIARTGTAKRQLNDRPEEVIARLDQLSGHEPALVLTESLTLTYEINERGARGKTALRVCSIWDDPVHGHPPGLELDVLQLPWVFVVSEVEAEPADRALVADALASSRRLIQDERSVDLGQDPDWKLKSRLSGQRLEPYRFHVWYGHPRPGDWRAVGEKFTAVARLTILAEGG